eukprot:TRINITY_DN109283_c0_g1_i1.p1 TRINITY_DN109283_c0_g1~~TRINITY_DN109283_c0_g1_i1.p1  ORF type:complete len:322 (-),score=39.11 TRINITY_DN109283_c0_g1_i1:126-1091(-)
MVAFRWGVDRSITGFRTHDERAIDLKATAAELIAMLLFVTIGCGTACAHGASDGETRLVVAFAFGMAIMVLAYSIGHHSGGHINCAVTFSLVVGGVVPWYQGIANLGAQLLGSLLGACLLAIMFPCETDLTTTLGTNIINQDYHPARVLVSEAFGTFLLCFTVWETAVTSQASCGKNACIAIGFAVFLAHLVLLPIDGCSINPTRSFGPAIVSSLRGCENYTPGGERDLWVMWLGPLIGGGLAALFQYPFAPDPSKMSADHADEQTTMKERLDLPTIEGALKPDDVLISKARNDNGGSCEGLQSKKSKAASCVPCIGKTVI